MNRLLIVFILLVAGVIGLGFYMKWVHIASDNTDDKIHINVEMDKDKIHEDEKKALEKVKDLGHQVKDKAAGPTEKKDKAAPPVEPTKNEE